MNYQKEIKVLALLPFLVIGGLSTTDTTLINCPAQYNLTHASLTVNASESLIELFFSGSQGSDDESRIQEIVITGDYDELDKFIRQKMVPYIIIGCIVFVIYLLLIFYCIFDKSWPPCERFRRNPIQEPYTRRQKRCMAFWVFFLAAAIFIAGIVSFTAIPRMKYYVRYAKCSLYYLLDESLNGDTDNGWGGFVELKNKIGSISSLLDSAATEVTTYISGDDWLIDDMVIMKNTNIDLYNKYKDSQLITPNPVTTETNLNAGLDFPTIDSVFIESGLGPNGTFGTMVDDIDRGLRTTELKSQQGFNIEVAAQSMIESTPAIQTNAVAAQNTLQMYISQIQTVENQLDQFSQRFFDSYFSYAIYLLQGVIGFVLVSSLLILIGALSTHCYDILQCRYMVHCGWFLYGLMYIGILCLAFVTMGIGQAGYSSCQYFKAALSDSSQYNRIGDAYSQNVFNRLDVCILGNGDALSQFDISDEMTVVMDLFTNISAYYDYDNTRSSNYVDLDISTGKISGWINAMQKYRLGVYIDSRNEETTNDNPNYAIEQLNLYTNEGAGVPTCSKDRWVFDSENCTDSSQITYSATPSQANGIALSDPEITCISFNQKLTTAMPSSWTQSDFTRRYVQVRQDCPDAYDKIIYYGYSIINYRDSRIDLYQGIKDDLSELYSLNNDFNVVMDEFRGRVDQFYQSVAILNDIVASQLDGLLVTSNCQVVGDNAQTAYNIICINFMSEVAVVAMCVLILLITVVGGMFAASVFGVRYANIQIVKRVTGEEHEHLPEGSTSDKIPNLDKQMVFSERSHSSEDDYDQEEKGKGKK